VYKKVDAYKKNVLAKGIIKAHDLINEKTRYELRNKLHNELDVMAELNILIARQTDRTYRALEEEALGHTVKVGTGKNAKEVTKFILRKEVSSNVRLLSEMLDRQARIQMELGILRRAPVETKSTLHVTSDDRAKMEAGLTTTKTLANVTMETLAKISKLNSSSNHEPITVEQIDDTEL
jgi:hypothetical protein